MIEPPYPNDLEAKGWSLDLDYEKIEQSDTWAIASPEQRPWLLMLWLVSWRQSPVASLPNNDRLIAARIGMSEQQFTAWREVLLSGWDSASDGRLYHKTLTQHVFRMAEKRNKDRARVAAFRSKLQIVEAGNDGVASCNALLTHNQRVSSKPTPTPTPTPTKAKKEQAPSVARGSRLPTDWKLPSEWLAWAKVERPDISPESESECFADYWKAKPGKDGCKADWEATWRNWVRKAHARPRNQSGSKPAIAQQFANKTYVGTPDDELPAFLR